jgi:hypothetical protein
MRARAGDGPGFPLPADFMCLLHSELNLSLSRVDDLERQFGRSARDRNISRRDRLSVQIPQLSMRQERRIADGMEEIS